MVLLASNACNVNENGNANNNTASNANYVAAINPLRCRNRTDENVEVYKESITCREANLNEDAVRYIWYSYKPIFVL